MMYIKKNNEKYYEVAVLFERLEEGKDTITKFKPITIVLGKFNKKELTFTDINGKSYFHMSNSKVGEVGFGLRTSLNLLKEIYNKESIRDCVKKFYNEIRFEVFYFGASGKNYDKLHLVGENKFNHVQSFYDEEDILSAINIPSTKKDINTKQLINNIKKNVVGQNDAIDDIVTVLWQNDHSDVKRNLLLIGPTGVGKTEIIKNISKELDIPLVIASASGLTKAGYKGESVEDVLRRLYKKANGDIKKAENGIIVLDEFDKLASQGVNGDTISTSGVQEELLKFTEGCEYDLDISDDPMISEYVSINTSGITFIAMGAFADIERQDRTRTANSIGFGSRIEDKKDSNSFYKNINNEDLIKYGIIAELVGRFPIIIPLNPVSKELLIQIMNNPNTNVLSDKVKILSQAGIKLRINNIDAVNEKIVNIALEKKIGVRGLSSVIEKAFVKAMREVSQSNGEYDELIIDENTIEDPKKYVLIKKK